MSIITATTTTTAELFEGLAVLDLHDLRNVIQCLDLRTLALALRGCSAPVAGAVFEALYHAPATLAELHAVIAAFGSSVPEAAIARARRTVVATAAAALGLTPIMSAARLAAA